MRKNFSERHFFFEQAGKMKNSSPLCNTIRATKETNCIMSTKIVFKSIYQLKSLLKTNCANYFDFTLHLHFRNKQINRNVIFQNFKFILFLQICIHIYYNLFCVLISLEAICHVFFSSDLYSFFVNLKSFL